MTPRIDGNANPTAAPQPAAEHVPAPDPGRQELPRSDAEAPAAGHRGEQGDAPASLLDSQRASVLGMEFGALASSNVEGGAAGWMVTFADMMTLLMCFFVLLFSFSQVDVAKFQQIARSMSAALGGKPMTGFVPEGDVSGLVSEGAAAVRQRQMAEHYADKLRRNLGGEIKRGGLAVDAQAGIITLRILQNGSFTPGSADLQADFLPTAIKIRDALKDIPGAITVAGHTDDTPIATSRFRSNWELSGARAFSVMDELLRGGVLKDDRFVLMGYAATKPLEPNDSEAHRRLNRRVEIIIDQRGLSAEEAKSASAAGEILGTALRQEVGGGILQVDRPSPIAAAPPGAAP